MSLAIGGVALYNKAKYEAARAKTYELPTSKKEGTQCLTVWPILCVMTFHICQAILAISACATSCFAPGTPRTHTHAPAVLDWFPIAPVAG